jgi:predicted TIM-barrel fold metal-dependent hydrolase
MIEKTFDAHFHIIDPEYPLYPNNGYLPEPFSLNSYEQSTRELNIKGGAIVSGSFQKFDQTYLIASLEQLDETFVGVTQLPASTPDEEILELNRKGIKAVRFNLKRGGSETLDQLTYFAQRVHELANWHIEFYVDSKELADMATQINQLPRYSIDHLGLSRDGLPQLLKQVEKGAFVKATGFSRTDFPVAPVLREIYSINPHALMFGTDLPSTRAPRSFSIQDVQIIRDHFDADECDNIFFQNASRFYRNL